MPRLKLLVETRENLRRGKDRWTVATQRRRNSWKVRVKSHIHGWSCNQNGEENWKKRKIKQESAKNTSSAARNSHLYAVVPGHLISHNTPKTCIFAMVGAKRSAGVHVWWSHLQKWCFISSFFWSHVWLSKVLISKTSQISEKQLVTSTYFN